jgi:hypothetical protein
MQTNPISTEMSARVHFGDLAREAEQRRKADLVEQQAKSEAKPGFTWGLPLVWLRLVTTLFAGARA